MPFRPASQETKSVAGLTSVGYAAIAGVELAARMTSADGVRTRELC